MITALPKMAFGWFIVDSMACLSLSSFYPFNDDEDFAELQAEELCDKLNEKEK